MTDRILLEALIKKSLLLTDAEREYWLRHLPTMSEPHIAKLQKILGSPIDMPFMKQVESYVVSLAKGATAALNNSPNAA